MPRKTARAPTPFRRPLRLLARSVRSSVCSADGASIAELIVATGWLPHTVRAALTGLRKWGHAIGKSQRDGTTHYRIDQAPKARGC